MNCDGVRGLLSAYLDGELSPGELLRVEQHLRRCHCCADEVDALRQTMALVKTLDEVEVPATFRASLHDRLVALGPPMGVPRVPAARSWQRHLRTWALPAAAAAAVLAVGIGQVNQLGTVVPGEITSHSVTLKQPTPPPPPVAVGPVGGSGAPDGATQTNQPPVGSVTPVGTTTAAPSSDSAPKALGSGVQNADTPVQTPAARGKLSSVLEIHTASLVDNLTQPEALPAKVAKSYGLTAKVADQPAVVGALKSAFTGAAEVTTVGQADIATSVVITVPVKEAEGALANIRTLLGQHVAEVPAAADLAPEIQQAYERLTNIDHARELVLGQAEGVTDPERVEQFRLTLVDLDGRAKVHREQYQRLQGRVSTVTITVYLQK